MTSYLVFGIHISNVVVDSNLEDWRRRGRHESWNRVRKLRKGRDSGRDGRNIIGTSGTWRPTGTTGGSGDRGGGDVAAKLVQNSSSPLQTGLDTGLVQCGSETCPQSIGGPPGDVE